MRDNLAQQKKHATDFGLKQMRLKTGDVRARTKRGLTAIVWKDR